MATDRLIWIVVDGLPLWLLERFAEARARLPLLTGLLDRQAVSALRPVTPNCQTPPSLFTLFSGLPPARHRLTGFDIPKDTADPSLDCVSAFDAYPRTVPLIWDAIGARGGDVRLCQIPFVSAARLRDRLLSSSNQFGLPAVAASVTPLDTVAREVAPGINLRGTATGSWLDVVGEPAQALSRKDWMPLSLGAGLCGWGGVFSIDGRPSLVLLGAWLDTQPREAAAGEGPPADPFRELPFASRAVIDLFRQDALGLRLIAGGAGDAERLLAGALRVVARRFWAEAIDAVVRTDCALVVAYQPTLDLLLHEILGLVDAESPRYSAEAARVADALLLDALEDIDGALRRLLGLCAAGDRLFVCSDHGMKPVDQVLMPNVELARLGLLKVADGAIDVAGSAAFFHPAETGAVSFDRAALAGHGLSREGVMDRLVSAFSAGTGRPCAWASFPGAPTGAIGAEEACFLVPGRGQTAKAGCVGAPVVPSNKTADHCATSEETTLHGVVMDLVPGFAPWPAHVPAQDVMQRLLERA